VARSMPIVEVRNKLTALPEELERDPEGGTVAVTRRGKPVLAIMPWDAYEAIVETLEILGDEALMHALRQSAKEAAARETVPWERVKAQLDS